MVGDADSRAAPCSYKMIEGRLEAVGIARSAEPGRGRLRVERSSRIGRNRCSLDGFRSFTDGFIRPRGWTMTVIRPNSFRGDQGRRL